MTPAIIVFVAAGLLASPASAASDKGDGKKKERSAEDQAERKACKKAAKQQLQHATESERKKFIQACRGKN